MIGERWSTAREIKRALTRSGAKGKGGPILYYSHGQKWSYAQEGHLINLGVSGSGKSRRVIIPMIKSFQEAGESYIAVDPKGEGYYETVAEAEGKYRIHVIDFRHIFESECWNPLAEPYAHFISGEPDRKQIAMEQIENIAFAIYPPESEDPFWPDSARSLFIGAVYALMTFASLEQVNMAGVYQLIAQGDERSGGIDGTYLKEFVELLPVNSVAAMQLRSYVFTGKETAGSIRSVFLQGLSLFARSEGLMAMLGGDDLCIEELDGETPTAIYIILPDESPIFNSLAGILCSQLLRHYIRIAQDKYGGRLPRRLNVCLEELASIGSAVPTLDHLMSASRSRNIRCQLVLQSLSQLDTLYGSGKASTIRSNADVLVAFRTNHWDTLTELSHLCGEREVEYHGRISKESLITPTQLAAMETGQALVMISGRTKYITWLPDFTEMFDCSGFRPPKRRIREHTVPASFFDIQSFVKREKAKKINEWMKSPFERASGFDVDSLVRRIDARIAELEAEEQKKKKAEDDIVLFQEEAVGGGES